MQNLAEMLYAAMEPEDWENNAMSDNCPLPFGDVKRENVKYINRYFWERVVKGWNTTGVDEKVFGTRWGNLAIKMQSQNGGLHLLRKGYSWWFKTSNNCSLFEYTYKSGEYDKKANAHDVSHREVKQEVIKSKITVNCENDYTNEGWVNEAFFGDAQPRFIFRFATGTQLFGTTPNIYTTMAGKNGIKDEYVYTKMYNIPVGSHLDMEELKSTRSAAFYHTGYVYKDENGHHWMVTYMSGHQYDNSPYTELVSLDALTFSSDKAYATNAPSVTPGTNTHGITNRTTYPLFQSITSEGVVDDLNIICDSAISIFSPTLGITHYSPLCYENRGKIRNCRTISPSNLSDANRLFVGRSGLNSCFAGICVTNQASGEITDCACAVVRTMNESSNFAGICMQNNGTVIGCVASSPMSVKNAVNDGGICYENRGTV